MRKENIVRMEDGGEQKEFKVKQMSASQGERFFYKLILLLGGQAKVETLQDPLALLGALANQPFEKVQELLDEMLTCISRKNGNVETQLTPDNVDGFIENPITIFKLRAEVFKINNFFQNGGQTPLDGFNEVSATIKRRG